MIYLFTYLSICSFLFFRDRVSLCSPGCPGTHSVDQAGLQLRNLPASASQADDIFKTQVQSMTAQAHCHQEVSHLQLSLKVHTTHVALLLGNPALSSTWGCPTFPPACSSFFLSPNLSSPCGKNLYRVENVVKWT